MTTTTAAKNTMLDSLTVNKIRLHSGATTNGTQNKVLLQDGSSEAEAACVYAAAANAERDLSNPVAITGLDANSTVSHFSLWNNTTFVASRAFNTSEVYNGANGTANINTAKFTLSDA